MTDRQEKICRLISQEIQHIKRKCENPTQENYIYWCGYRDGLDKAHSLAQYAKGTDGGDPLLVPMLEQRTITVQRISEKESDVFGWMKYLEE